MPLKFKQLREMSDNRIIEKHDSISPIQNGYTLKETQESFRSELFRREIKRSNTIMTWLTGVILFLTLVNVVLVYFTLK